jgi:uncharacterized protein
MKVIPVIHHLNDEATLKNASICFDENAYGLFLISMTGDNEGLPMLAKVIKGRYPDLKVGLNLLGISAIKAVEIGLEFGLDITWSDSPIVCSDSVKQEAYDIKNTLYGTNHLFFNSVAFKYQKIDAQPGIAALKSKELGFIPTTSGTATGRSADLVKIKLMKAVIADYSLGLASGLTPENVMEYNNFIDYGLVSTGISSSFYEFDREKINRIVTISKDV